MARDVAAHEQTLDRPADRARGNPRRRPPGFRPARRGSDACAPSVGTALSAGSSTNMVRRIPGGDLGTPPDRHAVHLEPVVDERADPHLDRQRRDDAEVHPRRRDALQVGGVGEEGEDLGVRARARRATWTGDPWQTSIETRAPGSARPRGRPAGSRYHAPPTCDPSPKSLLASASPTICSSPTAATPPRSASRRSSGFRPAAAG